MHIGKKIDSKRYYPLFFLTFAAMAYFLVQTQKELGSLVIACCAIWGNHILLVRGIEMILEPGADSAQAPSKAMIGLLIISKFLILILGLYLSKQFAGKRVVIPLGSYFLLLLVLFISAKRTSHLS